MSSEIQASPVLVQGEITLTQFWGGNRGTCIQVTQPVQHGPGLFNHIQLSRAQALALASDLINWGTGEGWPTDFSF